jgi:hypothetical protein
MRNAVVAIAVLAIAGAAGWWYASSPDAEGPSVSHRAGTSPPDRIAATPQRPAGGASPQTNASHDVRADDESWTPPYWRQPRPPVEEPAKVAIDPEARMTLFSIGSASTKPADEVPARPPGDRLERERGMLTLQGTFGYRLEASKTGERSRVSVAGTLDCKEGRGTLSYRDQARSIDWLSEQFAFDAASICFADRENLNALVNRFNASIAGVYSPLTLDAVTQQAGENGRFDIRFISTDAAGSALRSAVFCVAMHGGAYASYRVPASAGGIPGCAVLDSFTIQRSRPT